MPLTQDDYEMAGKYVAIAAAYDCGDHDAAESIIGTLDLEGAHMLLGFMFKMVSAGVQAGAIDVDGMRRAIDAAHLKAATG